MVSRSKIVLAVLTTAIISLYPFSFKAYSADTKIKYKADTVTYEKGFKRAKLSGHVEVSVEDNIITAETIDVDFDEKNVSTEQDFKIINTREEKDSAGTPIKKKTEISGKSFTFNIDTKRLVARFANVETDAKAQGQKIYISGEEITVYNKGEKIAVINGDFTTCDHIEKGQIPHFNIKSSNLEFTPNESVVAWNANLFINGFSVYWFPFFYYPLKKDSESNSFNLDTGKNDTEGSFFNFKQYYNINDYHDGNYFIRLMEKKLFSIGFEHYWLAHPTSVSYLYAYGNPFNMSYLTETDTDVKKFLPIFFQDHQIYIRHEQWLPFLPNAQTNFTFDKKNFYNLQSISGLRTDYMKFDTNTRDEEFFEFKDLNISFIPQLKYNFVKTNDISNDPDRQKRNIYESRSTVQTFNPDISLIFKPKNYNDISLNLNGNYQDTLRESYLNLNNITLSNTKNYILGGSFLDNLKTSDLLFNANSKYDTNSIFYFKKSDLSTFGGNLSLNNAILPTLNLTTNLTYNGSYNKTYKDTFTPELHSDSFDDNTLSHDLKASMNLTQSLDWGKVTLSADNSFKFLDADLYPKDSNGNLISEANLDEKQKQKRNLANTKLSSTLFKQPELAFEANTLFKDTLPLNISATLGRYYQENWLSTTSLIKFNGIARSALKTSLASKEYDFGFGNKINFGNTGFEQRFYQTQDSEYQLTGEVNYKNDFTKYFVPSINYYKTIVADENGSPFDDRLAKNKRHSLSGNLGIGNVPEFNLNLSNIGYDFENKLVLSPIIFSLNSEFFAGANFKFAVSSGYNFKNITTLDINKSNTNFTGRKSLSDQLDNKQLTDSDFMKMYGYTKNEIQTDLNNNQTDDFLKNKYGIDNRLYDYQNREVIDNTNRLTEKDLGKLEFRGGGFNSLTLSLGIGTPNDFTAEGYLTKEDADTPSGIAGSLSTTFNIPKDNFYKPTITNGVTKELDFYKNLLNFGNRFDNFSIDLLGVIGGDGNPFSHTRLDLSYKFTPLLLLPDGQESTQKKRPPFPLDGDIYLSLKKGFHDLIFSFYFRSQYVPNLDKTDFSLGIDFDLTAFPELKNALNSATQTVNSSVSKASGF